ncbi:hypothetical protein BSU04_25505 [Caballeronia sordidicola]|uniref:Uncharacterized protein n=1 Tax=Caballeronia sordidicola TaxID=196367 RepID=A0A226WY94_CABSO|nr:hypothetical protein BSU04_25505 [Caballeronia sordidicola]
MSGKALNRHGVKIVDEIHCDKELHTVSARKRSGIVAVPTIANSSQLPGVTD